MCKSLKSRIAVSSAIGLDTSGFLCVFFGATSEYPATHLIRVASIVLCLDPQSLSIHISEADQSGRVF